MGHTLYPEIDSRNYQKAQMMTMRFLLELANVDYWTVNMRDTSIIIVAVADMAALLAAVHIS